MDTARFTDMKLICIKCSGRALAIHSLDQVLCEKCGYVGPIELFIKLREPGQGFRAWALMRCKDMDFSLRLENCLHNARIETLGQADMTPDHELLRINNFGRRSLNELRQAIEKMKSEEGWSDAGEARQD